MNVTFKDVAKLANVSTQTVSRVTNGSPNVAEETREKVNAAIKELGYVPNKGAQLLGSAKSKLIGLVTVDLLLHGASLVANGIRKQAKELGYGTSLSAVSEYAMDKIIDAINELKAQRVEFIILNLPLSKEDSEMLISQYLGINFVFLDVPPDAKVNAVYAANYEGGIQAAELMISLQKKRFLLITGPHESSASELRLEAWLDVLNKYPDVEIINQFEGDWQASSGYRLAHEALCDGRSFDCVLVGSDQMALGVSRALNEFNLAIPQDVSIIGFDDTVDSAYFYPPLTTIKQDFLAAGQRAVLLAISMADQPTCSYRHESIPTLLVKRKSTLLCERREDNKPQIRALLKQVEQLLTK